MSFVSRSVVFQSTPSVWRETTGIQNNMPLIQISIHSLRVEGDEIITAIVTFITISIHSLRVEGDVQAIVTALPTLDFNPLPPCGGRPCRNGIILLWLLHFNPLPPCGGRPAKALRCRVSRPISIHSLRVEGDPVSKRAGEGGGNFNPLPPCGGRPET